MRYEYIKVLFFWSLISTMPAMIFLIQVVILLPTNMIFSSVVQGFLQTPNDWGLILFFMGFFLIFTGIWALSSIVLAKIVCLFKNPTVRNTLVLLIVTAMFYVTFQPVYGSGGHGPATQWVTAAGLEGYSFKYWLHVFPPTLLLALCHLGFRYRKIQQVL